MARERKIKASRPTLKLVVGIGVVPWTQLTSEGRSGNRIRAGDTPITDFGYGIENQFNPPTLLLFGSSRIAQSGRAPSEFILE